MKRRRGFTLVELVIVLMIIAVLSWIVYPAYQGYITRLRIVQSITEVTEMAKAIHDQELRTGVLPASLAAIVDAQTGATLGYGARIDPWGFAYQYTVLRPVPPAGARKDKFLQPLNSDFDLFSLGPDGVSAPSVIDARSRDDVIRARDGGFYGTATDFDP